MLEIGTRVRIKDNVYEGSDDPDDLLARGKEGTVGHIGKSGYIEVITDDGEYYPLTTSEVEEIK